MTNRMLVGYALTIAEGHEEEYENLLNGLATALGVTPRHENQDGDNFYALMDLLTGLKDLHDTLDDKINVLDTRMDNLETRVEALESHH